MSVLPLPRANRCPEAWLFRIMGTGTAFHFGGWVHSPRPLPTARRGLPAVKPRPRDSTICRSL
jgi:hypothetical protein